MVQPHPLRSETWLPTLDRHPSGELTLIWGDNVIKHKSVCPTHNEAKRYQNVRVWSRERFTAGPCKETGGPCFRNPELPERFQQSPFIGKVREAHG